MKKINTFFKQLFSSKNGGLPIIFWITPILLWIVGGLTYLYINQAVQVKQTIKAASMAIGLQEDINFISTKTKATEVFNMSKKELIKANTNDNFLMRKVRRNLDKSLYAKSMGTKDEVPIEFDENLSPKVALTAEKQLSTSKENTNHFAALSPDSLTAIQDLNFVMDKIKAEKVSNYEYLETERKAKLAAAKEENRKKRVALDHSTLDKETLAYQKGLQDQQKHYNSAYEQTTGTRPRKSKSTKRNNRLQFTTATGIKDELSITKTSNPAPTNHPIPNTNQIAAIPASTSNKGINQPLYGVLDRVVKLKTGDKVRLRIIQEGQYKGYLIQANQVLYGICKVGAGRVNIRVASINLDGEVLPANLVVYDLDGMQGIYVEGATIDVGKETIREGLREVSSLGIRNPLGNLSLRLGRKANKGTSARIPSGYQVLLYDVGLNK